MKNKKGIVGSFIATFIATIIIVILIGIFIFSSGIIKSTVSESSGQVIFNEESLGLEYGVGYMENYIKLMDAKSRVNINVDLEEALNGVRYNEK